MIGSMAQANRVTQIDPSKRTDTPEVTPPTQRELHHPLEGLAHPAIIGTVLSFALGLAIAGTFTKFQMSLSGFYMLFAVYSATVLWKKVPFEHAQGLDGEYAWMARLLITAFGGLFVEIGIGMNGSSSYAVQTLGFFILAAYNVVLLATRNRS